MNNAFVFAIVALSVCGPLGHTESNRQPAAYSSRFRTTGQTQLQSVVSGTSLSQKEMLFRSLLASSQKGLNWPAFPRTWHEQSESTIVNTNTSLGLNLMGFGGAVAIDYKWSLKTSIVLIAANQSNNDELDVKGVSVNGITDPIRFELFQWDPVKMRAYPRVDQDYPMVAFCAFEASLNYSESARGGVQFMGSGQTVEGTKTRSISHTMFSRFFQIDGSLSTQQVLTDVCEKVFRPEVESYANRDFSRSVVEFYAHQHSRNQCQVDADCDGWFKKRFPSSLRSITVARCELTRIGLKTCSVKALEGVGCPLYAVKGSDKLLQTAQVLGNLRARKISGAAIEFDCDRASGMVCEMESPPRKLFGVPITHGESRCRRA